MSSLRVLALAALLALVGTAAVAASPTPAPGGANAVNAISGKVGDTLWNGVVRFKVVEVRDATPADHPESVVPLATQKVMVVTAIIRNGTPATWGELVSYTLADKDYISFEIPGHFFTPVGLTIQQGAAVKQTALFPIDKTYVPVKLIFSCGSCGKGKFKPFRVTIPAPAQ
jgi:hypothetical protein